MIYPTLAHLKTTRCSIYAVLLVAFLSIAPDSVKAQDIGVQQGSRCGYPGTGEVHIPNPRPTPTPTREQVLRDYIRRMEHVIEQLESRPDASDLQGAIDAMRDELDDLRERLNQETNNNQQPGNEPGDDSNPDDSAEKPANSGNNPNGPEAGRWVGKITVRYEAHPYLHRRDISEDYRRRQWLKIHHHVKGEATYEFVLFERAQAYGKFDDVELILERVDYQIRIEQQCDDVRSGHSDDCIWYPAHSPVLEAKGTVLTDDQPPLGKPSVGQFWRVDEEWRGKVDVKHGECRLRNGVFQAATKDAWDQIKHQMPYTSTHYEWPQDGPMEKFHAPQMMDPALEKISGSYDGKLFLPHWGGNRFIGESSVSWEIKRLPGDVIIEAEAIDQDDPENEAFETLDPANSVVYHGSVESTADNLKLKAVVRGANANPVKFRWSVYNSQADYNFGHHSETSHEWDLGDLLPGRASWDFPDPGIYTFKVEVEFDNGMRWVGKREFEVGVRTDDIVVIGWINPNGVPLSGSGVHQSVTQSFPRNRLTLTNTQRLRTLGYLGYLSAGGTSRPQRSGALSASDKQYILNWLFRYAGNFAPPPTRFADEDELQAFKSDVTRYKLFNRLQIKYLVEKGIFKGQPEILKQDTRIGTTIEPILGMLEPGQAGPNNGRVVITQNTVSLVNDGTPAAAAVRAFNTLAAPLKWNNIGSKIELGVPHKSDAKVDSQVYPTYEIFHNLTQTGARLQASNPIQNFSTNPYPPGPAPFKP